MAASTNRFSCSFLGIRFALALGEAFRERKQHGPGQSAGSLAQLPRSPALWRRNPEKTGFFAIFFEKKLVFPRIFDTFRINCGLCGLNPLN
jgi:hypothetical protein